MAKITNRALAPVVFHPLQNGVANLGRDYCARQRMITYTNRTENVLVSFALSFGTLFQFLYIRIYYIFDVLKKFHYSRKFGTAPSALHKHQHSRERMVNAFLCFKVYLPFDNGIRENTV